MKKIKVGVLGATGMVGYTIIKLLENHPWFDVVVVAASPSSAGKLYKDVLQEKRKLKIYIPKKVGTLKVLAVEKDINQIIKNVDIVFSSLDMENEKIKKIEELLAKNDIPVISTNSTNRWIDDVPMIIPEINSDHLKLIEVQRKNRGWKKGFIVVKPNCSIQSYVMILTALKKYKPRTVAVTSMQAISGAGKTFKDMPEIIDNIIPYIGGEEEKSEKEPMRIWGKLNKNKIKLAKLPKISATCVRVPASDGHLADISVDFLKPITSNQILKEIDNFNKNNVIKKLNLPSSPKKLIIYIKETNRPQTKLDRDYEHGMGISMGRLRKGSIFDWKFLALSHNLIRGAAGGAVLTAELCLKKGYIKV